ncbi:MAG: hypothetical protein ABI661_05605, partial [Gammaproteobacteria bacterium]
MLEQHSTAQRQAGQIHRKRPDYRIDPAPDAGHSLHTPGKLTPRDPRNHNGSILVGACHAH